MFSITYGRRAAARFGPHTLSHTLEVKIGHEISLDDLLSGKISLLKLRVGPRNFKRVAGRRSVARLHLVRHQKKFLPLRATIDLRPNILQIPPTAA
jgi:hypothetical protein